MKTPIEIQKAKENREYLTEFILNQEEITFIEAYTDLYNTIENEKNELDKFKEDNNTPEYQMCVDEEIRNMDCIIKLLDQFGRGEIDIENLKSKLPKKVENAEIRHSKTLKNDRKQSSALEKGFSHKTIPDVKTEISIVEKNSEIQKTPETNKKVKPIVIEEKPEQAIIDNKSKVKVKSDFDPFESYSAPSAKPVEFFKSEVNNNFFKMDTNPKINEKQTMFNSPPIKKTENDAFGLNGWQTFSKFDQNTKSEIKTPIDNDKSNLLKEDNSDKKRKSNNYERNVNGVELQKPNNPNPVPRGLNKNIKNESSINKSNRDNTEVKGDTHKSYDATDSQISNNTYKPSSSNNFDNDKFFEMSKPQTSFKPVEIKKKSTLKAKRSNSSIDREEVDTDPFNKIDNSTKSRNDKKENKFNDFKTDFFQNNEDQQEHQMHSIGEELIHKQIGLSPNNDDAKHKSKLQIIKEDSEENSEFHPSKYIKKSKNFDLNKEEEKISTNYEFEFNEPTGIEDTIENTEKSRSFNNYLPKSTNLSAVKNHENRVINSNKSVVKESSKSISEIRLNNNDYEHKYNSEINKIKIPELNNFHSDNVINVQSEINERDISKLKKNKNTKIVKNEKKAKPIEIVEIDHLSPIKNQSPNNIEEIVIVKNKSEDLLYTEIFNKITGRSVSKLPDSQKPLYEDIQKLKASNIYLQNKCQSLIQQINTPSINVSENRFENNHRHDSVVNAKQSDKNLELTKLYSQLNSEYQNYLKEVSKELGSLIRKGKDGFFVQEYSNRND